MSESTEIDVAALFDVNDLATELRSFEYPESLKDRWGYPAYDIHGRAKFLQTARYFGLELDFCQSCGEAHDVDTSVDINGYRYCEDCAADYGECDECHYMSDQLTFLDDEDRSLCRSCVERSYEWCDNCEEWSLKPHDHSCQCESPAQSFSIRNNGEAPLPNDTRATITLPSAGELSEVGRVAIETLLGDETGGRCWGKCCATTLWERVGTEWQTKEGNYPKRLQRVLYKSYSTKLSPEAVSAIGNLARVHIDSASVSVDIEITRRLNLPAKDFHHAASCWWGSFSHSRCTLKSNGGFGVRSFDDERVSGRAWVMPMRQTANNGLTPTFNTETPDAFLVFNGYGALSGYVPARILAYMAGLTYRKISFDTEDAEGEKEEAMYINAGAYLIAGPDLCSYYEKRGLALDLGIHSGLFAVESANIVAPDVVDDLPAPAQGFTQAAEILLADWERELLGR